MMIITIKFTLNKNEMIYVKADIEPNGSHPADNNMFMVQNRKDSKQAANFLAKLRNNIFAITDYTNQKLALTSKNPKSNEAKRYNEFKPYILQLSNKIKNVEVREAAKNSVTTSYTVNKGEQIVFCIRSKSITSGMKDNIHDFNLVMYVLLHEISHVACPEYDHTPLFKKIFKFLCEEAIEMGIYQKIDFVSMPHEYCGMTINDSII